MRLTLWTVKGNKPVEVPCSTEHWVGGLQPLVEEPFTEGDYTEARIGSTHFQSKPELMDHLKRKHEEAMKDLDMTEQLLKQQLKDTKAQIEAIEQSLVNVAKQREAL